MLEVNKRCHPQALNKIAENGVVDKCYMSADAVLSNLGRSCEFMKVVHIDLSRRTGYTIERAGDSINGDDTRS